jgi:hypothetical protein
MPSHQWLCVCPSPSGPSLVHFIKSYTTSSSANVFTAHTTNEVMYPINLPLAEILTVLVDETRPQSLFCFILFSPALLCTPLQVWVGRLQLPEAVMRAK